MLKFLLKPKDVLYQVSSGLGEVNSFYSSFSDAGQKAPLPFKDSKKLAWYRVKFFSCFKSEGYENSKFQFVVIKLLTGRTSYSWLGI